MLYSFGSSGDVIGNTPSSGLTLGSDGNLYGSTKFGYPYNSGTIFRLTTNGTVTAIWSNNVQHPISSSLVLGQDGNFYAINGQSVFKSSTNGTLNWFADIEHGSYLDSFATLTAGLDGNLYGTTSVDGANNSGTIFRLTLQGTYTRLYSFTGLNGASPRTELVEGTDGSFMGSQLRAVLTILAPSSNILPMVSSTLYSVLQVSMAAHLWEHWFALRMEPFMGPLPVAAFKMGEQFLKFPPPAC